MPWNLGPSVNQFDNMDCWRTWFFEECEEHQLFGLTEKHLPLITKYGHGVVPYKVGTNVLLEDAPLFHESKTQHRVCGPYEVYPFSVLPDGAEPIFPKKGEGEVLIYKEVYPENGPWINRSVHRKIEGRNCRFQQMASKFSYFPYRFGIRHTKLWKVKLVKHGDGCPLCK